MIQYVNFFHSHYIPFMWIGIKIYMLHIVVNKNKYNMDHVIKVSMYPLPRPVWEVIFSK